MLRKAFTILELIFIITIIGILSLIISPRLQSNNLQEATDQIVKHMRLAQSLALAQDFYLSEASQSNDYSNENQKIKSSTYWFKRWWRIQFHQASNPSDDAYSVYSDHPDNNITNGTYDAQADASDIIALDAHSGQKIIRDLGIGDENRLRDVHVESTYNVTISMATCSHVSGTTTAKHIIFDHLGRPHCSKGDSDNALNPFDHLAKAQIRVTLEEKSSQERRVICVEQESGYIHICA